MTYFRRTWFWCPRYCYWSCLTLFVLLGTMFSSIVKRSWTKNDGPKSGRYYFMTDILFNWVDNLIEGTSHGVFGMTRGSADATYRFCYCSKADQIPLWTSTALESCHEPLGQNKPDYRISLLLPVWYEQLWKSLGHLTAAWGTLKFCSHFSRCRFQVLEKQMVICFPGHLSLSFLHAVVRNSTTTSEAKGLKIGFPF